jgi:hypothetical protein
MRMLAAALLLSASAALAAGAKAVSLLALIAEPAKYDGRKVAVTGYLRLEEEGDAVYLHEEDYRQGLTSNGLWVNVGSACAKTPDQQYVRLEGTFDAKDQGHLNLWSGALKDVTRCEPWGPVAAPGMKSYKKLLKSP